VFCCVAGNLANLQKLDDGYLGKSIYFTLDAAYGIAEYSCDVYGNAWPGPGSDSLPLLICAIIPGNALPVIEDPNAEDSMGRKTGFMGEGMIGGADSHIALMAKDPTEHPSFPKPSDPLPSKPSRWKDVRAYTEIGVRDEAQVYPMGYLMLRAKPPLEPALDQTSLHWKFLLLAAEFACSAQCKESHPITGKEIDVKGFDFPYPGHGIPGQEYVDNLRKSGHPMADEAQGLLDYTENGDDWADNGVHRPNHSLAHVMRQAWYVPIVLAYARTGDTPLAETALSELEMLVLQLKLLFEPVGRFNESDTYYPHLGFALRDAFLKALSDKGVIPSAGGFLGAFQQHFTTEAPDAKLRDYLKRIGVKSAEDLKFTPAVPSAGDNDPRDPVRCLWRTCHVMDGLRCRPEGFCPQDADQTMPFKKGTLQDWLRRGESFEMLDYVRKCILKTGDRILTGNPLEDLGFDDAGRDGKLFTACSRDPAHCLRQIAAVPLPYFARRGAQ